MSNKYVWYTSGSGEVEFKVKLSDANIGYQSGECSDSIAYLMTRPYIKKQLDTIPISNLKNLIETYGVDVPETDNEIKSFVLWIACGDIVEDENRVYAD